MEHYKNLSLENIEGEIWKPLLIGKDYLISNFGRIKTLNHRGWGKESIIMLTFTKHGFVRVNLWANKRCVGYSVHDLVAREFVPNQKGAFGAFHKNGVRHDNTAENLSWEVPDLENEIWKDIENWESIYQVSNCGRIKSLSRERKSLKNSIAVKSESLLKPLKGKFGYLRICFKHNGTESTISVHRLVGKAFIPNSENLPCINHKNGIKADNRVENLEWCTHQENTTHGIRIGLIDGRGERAHSCKLNPTQVLEIFNSKLPMKELLKIYPVKQNAIRKIREGKTWYSLTKAPNKNAGNYPV